MTPIVAIVILTGASCASPVEQLDRTTVAWQVPCAIVLREQSANPFKAVQQPNTITPAAAVPKYTYAPKKKKKKRKGRR